jgi:hypothetical protein
MIGYWKSRAPLAVLAVCLAVVTPSRADTDGKSTGVLKLLPADTAFFTSMLRNREQVEIVANSKAFEKLWNLPAMQVARQTVSAQLANPDPMVANVLNELKKPENQDLLALLAEAFSDEIFVYGSSRWVDTTNLIMHVSNSMQGAPLLAAMSAGGDDKARTEMQVRLALRVLAENVKLIQLPDLVIGLRIKDTKKAEAQIKRLEDLIRQVIEMAPPIVRDGFKRVKVGTSSVLNYTLDGSNLPWDEFHIKDYEEKDGEFDALLQKLKSLKLSISLGVHQGYIVLAIGQSPQDLAAIGASAKRLSDLPEFRPMNKFADKRITSIGYVSKALKATVAPTAMDYKTLTKGLEAYLKSVGITPQQIRNIRKDLEVITADMSKSLPEPGASMSFSFLTETGTESYSYDFSTFPNGPDGSKPLTLVEHVGGNPILWAVGRSKVDVESYRKFSKAMPALYGHVEEVVLTKLDEDQKTLYERVKKEVLPLVKQLDEITGTLLLPAIVDGQVGFVLDAKWKSTQWHAAMPKTPKSMPMPELGIVIGISDEAKFLQAMRDYFALINDSLEVASKLSDGKIPVVKLPPATVIEKDGYTFAYYPIPDAAGLDPQVVPTAGVSKNVVTLAFSRSHARRILTATPLEKGSGLLSDVQTRSLASASAFNWPVFVDAAKPWIEMGVVAAHIPPVPDGPDGDVLKQVRTVLEVLKVYRGSATISYFEDSVLVTHSESTVIDLK